MVSLNFYLDKRYPLSDQTCPICITIRCQQKSRILRTGISVKESQWDGQKVIKHKLGPALNVSLEEMMSRARRAILDTESKEGKLDITSALEVVTYALFPERKKEEKEDPLGLVHICNIVADTKRESTRDTYLRTIKHLREYIAPAEDIPIEKITASWLKSFDKHLEEKRLVLNTTPSISAISVPSSTTP